MNLQDLIARFRSQVGDEDVPYLWDDPEALEYATDAQDMFCRLVEGIADRTVAAADIGNPQTRLQDLAVTTGNPYAAISPYILRIRNARLLTANADIGIINQADLGAITDSNSTWDYGWTKGLQLDDTDAGDVRFGMLGLRDGYVRWFRVPVADDTVRLSFYRLPYPRIADESSALEIGEEHHLHLVKWMKHLAYSKQDGELYDKDEAARSESAFRAYCEQARGELERRRYKPRQVQFNPGYWGSRRG